MACLRVALVIALAALARAIPLSEDVLPLSSDVDAAVDVDYRLHNDVIPRNYTMMFVPHIVEPDFKFEGTSEIEIDVVNATTEIVLHAKDLKIKSVTITQKDEDFEVSFTTPDPTTDFLTLTVKKKLAVASATIKLNFEGVLNDQLKGFYRSSYINADGKKVWLATTHFEPTYARYAFPCFDEPALKATFEISIKHKKSYTAISNMHVKQTKVDPENPTLYITDFAKTPVMSTYLVAFVVSDFESKYNEDLNFYIWARKNAIQHGTFALENGEKALRELEKYTSISHKDNGFVKMDSIAIPDFSSGAMENWGLVTYRETGLLVEENVTTTSSKEGVATVMSHEFAHQWFGNLVSPLWWTYTWLNEGFANYFQYFITDKILPEWRLMDQQVIKSLQGSAFVADASSSIHAMNVEVDSPTSIRAIFDSISYQKAGSVIRMISHIVGEEKFQEALQKYLKEMAGKAATSDDLFAEFAKVYTPEKLDFKTILNNWANTPGFPVINVTISSGSETGTATITQERYLYNPDPEHKETYYVPINYATKSNKNFDDTSVTSWIEPTDAPTNISGPFKKGEWVIFNKQHFGYYRVNYDKENWQLITKALKDNHTDIHVINRAQLIDDVLNLARIGKVKYSIAFQLADYLRNEVDYIPWYSAFVGFSHLRRLLVNTDGYSSFKEYIVDLTGMLLNTVSFDESADDDHVTKYLRVDVLNWASTLGSKICRDNAFAKVSKWLENSHENRLSPDTKSVVLCAGVRNVDQTTWDKLLEKYLREKDSALLSALGCTSNTKILQGFLEKILVENSTLLAERDTVLTTVYSNSDEGITVALDFIITNAQKFVELSGNKVDSLKSHMTNIGLRITTQSQLDKLEEFSKNHANLASAAETGIKNGKENLSWNKNQGQEIIQYFKKKEPEESHKDKGKGSALIANTVFTALCLVSLLIF